MAGDIRLLSDSFVVDVREGEGVGWYGDDVVGMGDDVDEDDEANGLFEPTLNAVGCGDNI